MATTIYCRRCKRDVPMLTEDEWSVVGPHLADATAQIKRPPQARRCVECGATRHDATHAD